MVHQVHSLSPFDGEDSGHPWEKVEGIPFKDGQVIDSRLELPLGLLLLLLVFPLLVELRILLLDQILQHYVNWQVVRR